MRRDKNIVEGKEWMVGRGRFLVKYVHPGTAKVAGRERLDEGLLVVQKKSPASSNLEIVMCVIGPAFWAGVYYRPAPGKPEGSFLKPYKLSDPLPLRQGIGTADLLCY